MRLTQASSATAAVNAPAHAFAPARGPAAGRAGPRSQSTAATGRISRLGMNSRYSSFSSSVPSVTAYPSAAAPAR